MSEALEDGDEAMPDGVQACFPAAELTPLDYFREVAHLARSALQAVSAPVAEAALELSPVRGNESDRHAKLVAAVASLCEAGSATGATPAGDDPSNAGGSHADQLILLLQAMLQDSLTRGVSPSACLDSAIGLLTHERPELAPSARLKILELVSEFFYSYGLGGGTETTEVSYQETAADPTDSANRAQW